MRRRIALSNTSKKKKKRNKKIDMLDCCRPLDYIRSNGITLGEFTCLAECNGLDANTKYADKI